MHDAASNRIGALRVAAAALLLGAGSSAAQVSVSFTPALVNLTPGEMQLVELGVTSVPADGIAAFQVVLDFDTAVIQVADPNAGFTPSVQPFAPLGGNALCTTVRGTPTCDDPAWLLTSTGRSAVNGLATVDAVGGSVTILTGTLIEAAAASGTGTIALLAIQAVAAGSDTVSPAALMLADGNHPPAALAVSAGDLIVNVGSIVDTDGDGVADSLDNCTLILNADQRDTNGDGFGNICDADLNGDNIVNVIDLGIFKTVFFTANGNADFNGDGIVNVIDLGILKSRFFQPPGPSGLNP